MSETSLPPDHDLSVEDDAADVEVEALRRWLGSREELLKNR